MRRALPWLAVVAAARVATAQSSSGEAENRITPSDSLISGSLVKSADKAGARAATTRRFYLGRPYGSEAQFNPLSQLLNEGFNNLAIYTADHRIGRQPYGVSASKLWSSVRNPEFAYRNHGWRRALTNELLPLSGREGGQWVPNYQDHLLGSGMVSARMVEWFQARGYAHPVLLGFATMTASHVLNEVVERPNPHSVDAITDLLVFDNLGFLLFRSARVQRLLSTHIEFTSWGGQPVLRAPDGSIENTSQTFVLRTRLPRTDRWRFLYYYGVTHLLGVSRDVGDGHWVSLGAGAGASIVTVSDTAADVRTIDLRPRYGAFLDRNGSLLASAVWTNNFDNIAELNVYPGAFRRHPEWPGLWIGVRRHGIQFGLISRLGLGIGW